MSLSLLKAQREPVRRALRRALEEVKAELDGGLEEKRLQTGIQKAARRVNKLQDLDQLISAAMTAEEASEEDWATEFDEQTRYQDEFEELNYEVQSHLHTILEDADADKKSSVSSQFREKSYRLPKLEMKKFSGEPKEWIAFWSQFRGIHEDEGMRAEEKFQYLIQATVDKSSARAIVDRFPPSAENYPLAIEHLKQRFGRKELLVEVYVRDLLGLVIKNIGKKGCLPLSSIYDTLETQLRSLESLGVTSDTYAAMLFPLVESALPEEVLRTWERNRLHFQKEGQADLACLMKFIRSEVESEERIKLARNGFDLGGEDKKNATQAKRGIPTATDLFSGETAQRDEKACVFCDKKHDRPACFLAKKMTMEDKKKKVAEKKACFRCLRRGHFSRSCKSKVSCESCGRRHHLFMCDSDGQQSYSQETTVGVGIRNATLTSLCSNLKMVLLQTLVVRVSCDGQEKIVRAIVDSGAQFTYISKKLQEALKLQKTDDVQLSHGLFGGDTKTMQHQIFNVQVSGLHSADSKLDMTVMNQSCICTSVGRVPPEEWIEELKWQNVTITDVGVDRPEIHLLIGADYAGEILTGRKIETMSGPVAVETKLGWTLMGKIPAIVERSSSFLSVSLCALETSMQNLWKLDVLGIRDSIEVKKEDKMIADSIKQFQDSIFINAEGRYEVGLPWLESHPPVADNLEVSKKRLVPATKKLKEQDKLAAYRRIFEEWKELGIVEEVPREEWSNPGSYLPHRPVFNPSSTTTSIRPVFDASAKSGGKFSVNECLMKGPNLIELIPAILLRFRWRRFGVIADIRKAFLQISLKKEDRDFLRFLWWESEDTAECGIAEATEENLKMFRHCRVVFGVSSSPFLLAATLNLHLDKQESTFAERMKKSFYVDNLVISLDTEEEVETFIKKCDTVMSEGKFELRGWEWKSPTSKKIEDSTPSPMSPVLGLLWNKNEDVLKPDMSSFTPIEGLITKRSILSAAQKIFDPMGFYAPVTVTPKLLLQKLWEIKLDWNKEVPEEYQKQFRKWYESLKFLGQVSIPRWIMPASPEECKFQLHLFCDGSKFAYGCCIFLRCEYGGEVTLQLIMGKARVAPKNSTIPRLELLACCIGSRILANVVEFLDLGQVETFNWTDSSNALYWIKKNENWSAFVFNRVQDIRRLTNLDDWRHVSGELNPADLPSRGCDALKLLNSRWWEGPSWLLDPEEKWPVSSINVDIKVISEERRKSTVSAVSTSCEEKWYEKFSSFRMTVGVLIRILRWKQQAIEKRKFSSWVTLAEREKAIRCLLRLVQNKTIKNQKGLLQQLRAVQDETGIWKVRTKIAMRIDSEDFRFPVLLSYNHAVTNQIIREAHEENCHAGVNAVMSILREKYWIPKTRRNVREVIQRCVICKRFDAKPVSVEEAPLPADRVRDAQPFEVIGVDLGGPMYVNGRKKVWFAVFTCAYVRAVHLEVVSSLSTKSFALALRRFIARRGRPRVIYSDNGTNFVGLENLLRAVDWKKIQVMTGMEKIDWRFSVPAAPWWGGFWERMVGLVKSLLRRSLEKTTLNVEQLQTLLYEVERVINSRPITTPSEDVEDPVALSPAMFLNQTRPDGVPDLDNLDETALKTSFGKLQALRKDLHYRFRTEYLGQLRHHDKKRNGPGVKVGDIVLLEQDNKKRIDWPVARIEELVPGRDGRLRMAVIKTFKNDQKIF